MTIYNDKTVFLTLIRLQRTVKKFMTKMRKITSREVTNDNSPLGPTSAHFFSKNTTNLSINNHKLIEAEVNTGIYLSLT